MIDLRKVRLALGLALAASPALPEPLPAQVTLAAHEDDAWAQDREPPYGGSGWTQSQGGSPPEAFDSSGVVLRSWLPVTDFDPAATAANDCWSYVSASGREYAIIGLSLGTGFVDVTDPDDAQIVAVLPGPTSSWRDIKTYQDHAYAVSEGGGGIQVFDLSQIDAGIVTLANTVLTGGREQSHDVAINTESGMLYRLGGGGSPYLGMRIYSLATPSLPVFVGEWHGRYCHDAQVVTWTEAPWAGVEVAFCYADDTASSGNPGIEILDVSDPANVGVIGSINLSQPPIFSHPAWYSHQGWLSEDRSYVYFNDEVDEAANGNPTTTRIIDVSDLANPTQIAIFTNGNSARDHNLFTRDGLIFEANYRSGLRVFGGDPLAPHEIAYFDTYPADDDPRYNGLWGVCPYFPSGTIVGSDIERGLFVWTLAAERVPSLGAPGILSLLALVLAAGTLALHRRGRGGWALPARRRAD